MTHTNNLQPDPGSAVEHSKKPDLGRRGSVLHVDCIQCTAREIACDTCVVTVLLGPPSEMDLDADDQAALAALASSGLVPPLQLVRSVPSHDPGVEDGQVSEDGQFSDGWDEPADWDAGR